MSEKKTDKLPRALTFSDGHVPVLPDDIIPTFTSDTQNTIDPADNMPTTKK